MEVHLLEEHLITELRLFQSLYGFRSDDLARWAHGCMPPESAGYYVQAWRQGRRNFWKYLERLAGRIRSVAGDSPNDWASRLHGLELLAGVDLHLCRPTTQQAFLDSGPTTIAG